MEVRFQAGRSREDEVLNAAAIPVWRAVRDKACTLCPAHETARAVCLVGDGPVPTDAVIVGESPSPLDDAVGRPNRRDTSEHPQFEYEAQVAAGQYFDGVLASLDIDPSAAYRTYAAKCLPPQGSTRQRVVKAARKACAPFLEKELDLVRPRAVLAAGSSAYFFFAHREGVTKNRGQAFEWTTPGGHTLWVVPTLSPAAVLLNPKHHASFVADISKWWRLAQGQHDGPGVQIVPVRTREALTAALEALDEDRTALLTYDLETRGFQSERAAYSKVWGIALCAGQRNAAGEVIVYDVILEHPEAPWYDDPAGVVREVVGYMLDRPRVSGHNVKFDQRWLRSLAERYGIAWHY